MFHCSFTKPNNVLPSLIKAVGDLIKFSGTEQHCNDSIELVRKSYIHSFALSKSEFF